MHPHQNPPGTLALRTSYPALAFMLALFKPKVTINGHEMPLIWGDNVLPLPPGLYHLKVHVPYLWPVGRAEMQIDSRYGPVPPIFYAAPWIAFMDGAIGHQPVTSPGKVAGILLMVLPLALFVLCCCGGLLLSALGG